MTRWIGNRAFMRLLDGHCVALQIDGVSGQLRCGSYEVRPALCRALERGSPECGGEIDSKSERPLIALRLERDQGQP